MAEPVRTINGVIQRTYAGVLQFRDIAPGQISEIQNWRVGTRGSGVRIRSFQVVTNPASALAGLRVQIGAGNSQNFFNDAQGATGQTAPLAVIAGSAQLPYILMARGFDVGTNQDMAMQVFNNNPFTVALVDVYFEGELLVNEGVAGDYTAEKNGIAPAGGGD